MTNIQDEVQKIHHQYGMSEVANYKIQLLCEKYAKEYHDSEVKKLNIPAVSHSFTLNEIGDKCQRWLDEEIAKDPKDQFSNREKYWMHEAYTAGFNEAIKNYN